MALTNSVPITLSAIQSEFSAGSLSAASTAAGLDPLPTSMLDFLGKSAVSIPTSLPGLPLRLSLGSDFGCYWIFRIFRQGIYEMEYNSFGYGDTYINVDTQVSYPTGSITSGDWISPKSSIVGDSYWVRFTGIYTSNLGWLSGYNYDGSITAEASPQISTRATPKTDEPFDSGWIRLNVDRAISINSGGDSFGSYAFIGGPYYGPRSPMRLQIASDSNGSNVVSDTYLGEFSVSTNSTG